MPNALPGSFSPNLIPTPKTAISLPASPTEQFRRPKEEFRRPEKLHFIDEMLQFIVTDEFFIDEKRSLWPTEEFSKPEKLHNSVTELQNWPTEEQGTTQGHRSRMFGDLLRSLLAHVPITGPDDA